MKSRLPIYQTAITILISLFIGIYVNALTEQLLKSQESILNIVLSIKYWNLLVLFAIFLTYFQLKSSTKVSMSVISMRETLINTILKAACEALIYPSQTTHIRAIVTLVDINCKTRTTKYFYNTSGDPEQHATFPIYFGVTGKALKNKCVVSEQLPENHSTTYDNELKHTILPEVKSILAAPLLNPNDSNNKPLGVLAFDSIHDQKKMKFDKYEVRRLAQDWAMIIYEIIKRTEE